MRYSFALSAFTSNIALLILVVEKYELAMDIKTSHGFAT